jgi:hypothetical protein
MMDTETEAKRRIVAEASLMLDGRRDLLEGCRNIVRYRAGLGKAEMSDDDVMYMVVVESELDDVPTGSARPHWAPEALAEKDRKAQNYLRTVNDGLLQACRALVQKWGPGRS